MMTAARAVLSVEAMTPRRHATAEQLVWRSLAGLLLLVLLWTVLTTTSLDVF